MVEGKRPAPERRRTDLARQGKEGCGRTCCPSWADHPALLVELYQQGLTNPEIAERMGICADLVRQLLKRYEVPAEPLWERRYRQAIAGREPDIVAAFLRLRSDRAVAQELGLQVSHVRRLIDAELPEANVLRRARRNLAHTYSQGEIIGALQNAALDVPSPMSIESYRLWAQYAGNGHRCPGPGVVKLRFGGWRKALVRAGLPTNSRGGPQATYAYPEVVAALADAWRELGRYPSVVRYDAWRAGRTQLPAAATARRLARSWDDLLVAAYPLVYAMRSASPTRGQRVPRRTTDAERPSSISC
ncbi:MAG: hypothetical protein ABR941_06045 [Thermoleophilia bacterium]